MTERERDRSWIHVSFHFLFARCFQTNVAKDKQEFFTMFHFVQSFVARCCKMQCVCVRSAEQSERPLILSRL